MQPDPIAGILNYLQAAWANGTLTRPSVALQNLRNNPRNFLEKFPIQGNFDPSVSGVTTAYIVNGPVGQRPGSTLKTLNMHATETFIIQPRAGQAGEGDQFQAHGLFTVQSNLRPQWYTLDNTGPDIMLTAKLTGCTFVARPAANGVAGAVDITHMMPNQETGLQLNQRMNTHGQKAWGRLKYDIDTRSVNIIGVRVGGHWKIYAQKVEKHALTIRSVHRIYP